MNLLNINTTQPSICRGRRRLRETTFVFTEWSDEKSMPQELRDHTAYGYRSIIQEAPIGQEGQSPCHRGKVSVTKGCLQVVFSLPGLRTLMFSGMLVKIPKHFCSCELYQ